MLWWKPQAVASVSCLFRKRTCYFVVIMNAVRLRWWFWKFLAVSNFVLESYYWIKWDFYRDTWLTAPLTYAKNCMETFIFFFFQNMPTPRTQNSKTSYNNTSSTTLHSNNLFEFFEIRGKKIIWQCSIFVHFYLINFKLENVSYHFHEFGEIHPILNCWVLSLHLAKNSVFAFLKSQMKSN